LATRFRQLLGTFSSLKTMRGQRSFPTPSEHIADLPQLPESRPVGYPKERVRRQKAEVDETQLEDLQHPGSSQELPAVEELELASSSEEDSAGSSKEQAAKASVPDN